MGRPEARTSPPLDGSWSHCLHCPISGSDLCLSIDVPLSEDGVGTLAVAPAGSVGGVYATIVDEDTGVPRS